MGYVLSGPTLKLSPILKCIRETGPRSPSTYLSLGAFVSNTIPIEGQQTEIQPAMTVDSLQGNSLSHCVATHMHVVLVSSSSPLCIGACLLMPL